MEKMRINKNVEPSIPMTGLDIPECVIEKENCTHTLKCSRIVIQSIGSQYIHVDFIVETVFSDGEKKKRSSSYTLKDIQGVVSIEVDEEGNEIEGTERKEIEESLMLSYWNASNAGREILESTTLKLNKIAENL